MSAFNQATIIIGEVGCYADLDINDAEEFLLADAKARADAAANVPCEWVRDKLGYQDDYVVRKIAMLSRWR
jgi:hypothetical protein